MIELKSYLMEEIVRRCRDCLPDEACGLLGGIAGPGHAAVCRVYPMRNLDESPRHFSMDAREQLLAVADMRKNGWSLLGNYHSHPSSPACPSAEDIRLAFDPSLHYLILSLADPREPVLRGFRICKGRAEREDILIPEADRP